MLFFSFVKILNKFLRKLAARAKVLTAYCDSKVSRYDQTQKRSLLRHGSHLPMI